MKITKIGLSEAMLAKNYNLTTCVRKTRFAYPSASGTHGAIGFAYIMRKVFNLLEYLLPNI